MESKLFEVRDRGTFIVVVAVRMRPTAPSERYLLRHCGYALDAAAPRLVAVARAQADGGEFHYDPFGWSNRTMRHAHEYIASHWETLTTGALIDVEYILGETPRPKTPERFQAPE